MALSNAQLVTVPVLDARFAAFEAKVEARFTTLEAQIDAKLEKVIAKLEQTKADLVRWVFLVMVGNVALSAGTTAVLNILQRGG
jgi:hypothetical protein